MPIEKLCNTTRSSYENVNLRFGRRVRHLRKTQNWSQLRMAEDFGIDRSFISDIENGKKAPSLNMIEVIAEGFKVSLPELFSNL